VSTSLTITVQRYECKLVIRLAVRKMLNILYVQYVDKTP
jgi:hypothetical protein